MAILVCNATPFEAKACRKGIDDAGLSNAFEVLQTGMGLQKVRRSLENRLRTGSKPSLVISSGFAGAFSEGLDLLEWISAEKAYLYSDKSLSQPFALQSYPQAHRCSIVSSADLIVDHERLAKDYSVLAAPVAVDMETAAIADVCRAAGVPCMMLRMITDTPREPLPGFLFSFTAADTAEKTLAKVPLLIKGTREMLKAPKDAARLVRNVATWSRLYRDGWARRASMIA